MENRLEAQLSAEAASQVPRSSVGAMLGLLLPSILRSERLGFSSHLENILILASPA